MQKRIPLYPAEIEGFRALEDAGQRLGRREQAAIRGVMERAGIPGKPVGFEGTDLIVEVSDDSSAPPPPGETADDRSSAPPPQG